MNNKGKLIVLVLAIVLALVFAATAIASPDGTKPDAMQLVGWWSMDEPGTGTRHDGQGGTDLSSVNSPGYSTFGVGQSITLDSDEEQYLYTNDADDVDVSGDSFTITAWVAAFSVPSSGTRTYVRHGHTGGGYWLYQTSEPKEIGCKIWGSSGAKVVTGTWRHEFTWYYWPIFCVYDADEDELSLWIGEHLATVSTSNVTPEYADDKFWVGAFNHNTGYYDGRVDELSVWKYDMSQDEMNWMVGEPGCQMRSPYILASPEGFPCGRSLDELGESSPPGP